MRIFSNITNDEWLRLCKRPAADNKKTTSIVKKIFSEVQANGDAALIANTEQFDGVKLATPVITGSQLKQWAAKTPAELKLSIDQAYDNIKRFHELQQFDSKKETLEIVPGVTCWRDVRAIQNVGLYIPGGTAPLISTVLMLGVPAQIAGCKRIIVATPPNKDGTINAGICYAALKIGVSAVVRVGGIQAIAGMTFGTDTVPKVDKIFGPGNQYVTAAKSYALSYGTAIDMPAGPSELLVYADQQANPEYIAADLLSQAEHGPDSQVVLVVPDAVIARAVDRAINKQLNRLPRMRIAQAALSNSFCLVLPDLIEATAFINEYAPEHLILNSLNSDQIVPNITNAGSIFLGAYSPESVGDYASGTNHTLPTNGWAKSNGSVSLDSFVKKITFQQLTLDGLRALAPTVTSLARAEGLEAHAAAVIVRLGSIK